MSSHIARSAQLPQETLQIDNGTKAEGKSWKLKGYREDGAEISALLSVEKFEISSARTGAASVRHCGKHTARQDFSLDQDCKDFTSGRSLRAFSGCDTPLGVCARLRVDDGR